MQSGRKDNVISVLALTYILLLVYIGKEKEC